MPKVSTRMPPSFTPAAQILWDAIPQHFQEQVLHNVWCPRCGDMTAMTDFTGEVRGKSLVLRGTCVTCRGKVARVLEGAPVREDLQPGNKVIWWKRIAAGDYVYPVQATVLALTAKRVKIERRTMGTSWFGMFHKRAYSIRDDSMRVRGRAW